MNLLYGATVFYVSQPAYGNKMFNFSEIKQRIWWQRLPNGFLILEYFKAYKLKASAFFGPGPHACAQVQNAE